MGVWREPREKKKKKKKKIHTDFYNKNQSGGQPSEKFSIKELKKREREEVEDFVVEEEVRRSLG